jgi:hypothetical protein
VLDICVAFVAGATTNHAQMADLKQKMAAAPDRLTLAQRRLALNGRRREAA